jgi:trimeric autotransporter adhesin
MRFLSWLRSGKVPVPTRPASPAARFRPRVEALEGRDLLRFSAPVVFPTLDETVALATGDVNGDGKPDLITAANSGRSIVVQLNAGKGTFGAPISYSGSVPGDLPPVTALAVGPYRGKPSIWALSYDPGWGTGGTIDIRTLQVTTKGTLTLAGVWQWTPRGPISSLAVADLDGDGATDLVMVPPGGGGLYVARANSSGGFGPLQSYSAPGTFYPSQYGPARVATGDFNGDGKPDVVVTDTELNAVSVLLNTGTGTFGAAQTSAVGGDPVAVAVGDVSGDGKLDLVTANTNGTASVLLGQGNGPLGAAQNYALGGAANSVALGDFN